jgi:hypothetical protein
VGCPDYASMQAGALPVPRLLAPLSTTTSNTNRPTFSVVTAVVPLGAVFHVEVCSDPACVSRITCFSSPAELITSAPVLPVGQVFWRARVEVNGQYSPPSPTWLLRVPSRTAARQLAGGQWLDHNKDGAPDVSVVFRTQGGGQNLLRVFVSPTGSNWAGSDVVVPSTISAESGAVVGDVNGDGASEHAIGGRAVTGVYQGTALRWSLTVAGAAPTDAVGWAVAGVGDLNQDGYGDLAVGAVGGAGAVYLFQGSAAGPVAWHTLSGPMNAGFGSAMAAGDFNGDGVGDVAVGAYFENAQTGGVYVFHGTSTWAAPPLPVAFAVPAGGQRGFALASGDFNGDGWSDLVVGAPLTAPGRAYLAPGATAGLQAPAELLPLSSGVSSFGRTLSMEDVNLDGFADVLVGASGDLGASTGRVFLFLGNAAGTVPTPLVLPAAPTLNQLGTTVSLTGALGGSGVGSMVVGAQGNYSNILPFLLACDVTGAGTPACQSVSLNPPVAFPMLLQSVQ